MLNTIGFFCPCTLGRLARTHKARARKAWSSRACWRAWLPPSLVLVATEEDVGSEEGERNVGTGEKKRMGFFFLPFFKILLWMVEIIKWV